MSKKRRSQKKRRSLPKGWRASPQQVEAWLAKAEQQLIEKEYASAAQTTRRVLRHVPAGSKPSAEALRHLGAALGLLQDFEGSYRVLTKALEVAPEDASIWYNRAASGLFTTRTGQALRDVERAIELERNPRSRTMYERKRASLREIVDEQIALRGPDYTVDQLIEEQETFQAGIRLMEGGQWAEAEELFRQVIAVGNVPPQPWANLAGCLIMQERYDEAEEALRRALEIEPDYKVARLNLAKLPYIRQHGPSAVSTRIKAAHEGHEIRQDVIFTEEQ
jgi:tetratricopeptide (TPR) repeat protein